MHFLDIRTRTFQRKAPFERFVRRALFDFVEGTGFCLSAREVKWAREFLGGGS